jgi:hypothetical protein
VLGPRDGIGGEDEADVGIIEQEWGLAERHNLQQSQHSTSRISRLTPPNFLSFFQS